MALEVWRALWPTKASLTEHNLPDQTEKVFMITGASSGVGEQLAQILYSHHAKVYIAARSGEKANQAIQRIKTAHPDSRGTLIFLHLDLTDLTTIESTASTYLAQESRLDTIWLNAGVMVPPPGLKTVQGHDLTHGTNNVAHFLLLRHLLPCLRATAKARPPSSVRVVWVSSSVMAMAPSPPIDFPNINYTIRDEDRWRIYARSKAGNVVHAAEFGRRCDDEANGILSLSLNPGNLRTQLQRSMPWWQAFIVHRLLSWPAIFGAYTELYAGLSDQITMQNQGAWVVPWGTVANARQDLWDPALGRRYWEWTEEQVKNY